ncbi:Nif3-like dinuclear metal center hexameric protein [Agriterribacter sp.]|uniref:Nif3-like dinuclear metal center hexameric protein n=1 Tax=Agriterribacter sp. TaxID=2821509 RepID=UPI002C991727|nr:Nif3-like dinuclear metal center hexameric protein [Agriterribacter sp.]HTN07485.1 Nif3-like dinuclear metal center hexameric protein [Agriterribacter sp.]
MKIKDIINVLENTAPPALQEPYDNAGLITGNEQQHCSGVLCSLDATEAVVDEAIKRKCNLIVAHHPVVFKGLKRITGKTYVERTIIKAIKNDIAIYAIHTNLDNIITGVNGRMADRLGLINRTILLPKASTLKKLYTFVPIAQAENLRTALFHAGAGYIGNYSQCSFNSEGTGTFKGEAGTHPFAGATGELHFEKEVKIEVIFPAWIEQKLVQALKAAHPYEEAAYDVVQLENTHRHTGAGLTGLLPQPMKEMDFLAFLKEIFQLRLVRHTRLTGRAIQKIALCGGAGSFLISNALHANVDIFISADIKYHEFFDADSRMVIADIGHFESEQYTVDLLHDILLEKFPTFAVLKTAVNTNPVFYYA